MELFHREQSIKHLFFLFFFFIMTKVKDPHMHDEATRRAFILRCFIQLPLNPILGHEAKKGLQLLIFRVFQFSVLENVKFYTRVFNNVGLVFCQKLLPNQCCALWWCHTLDQNGNSQYWLAPSGNTYKATWSEPHDFLSCTLWQLFVNYIKM